VFTNETDSSPFSHVVKREGVLGTAKLNVSFSDWKCRHVSRYQKLPFVARQVRLMIAKSQAFFFML